MLKNKFLYLLLIHFTLVACISNHKPSSLVSNDSEVSSEISLDSSENQSTSNQRISKNSKTLKLVSWNIQHLGRSKTDEDIMFMAEVLRDYDIVAIQEVVAKDPAGAQKVAQLADELNRKGAQWDYRISDPTKSPSVYISERYAFLWKTSKIDLIGRANLDKDLEAEINREPYIGKFKFKKTNTTFFLVNFHSRTYKDQPELEIRHFKHYPTRLESNHIIIAGDFNLNERHAVWNDLYQQGYKSAVNKAKTTLKWKCKSGDYLSHDIDNIYYSTAFSYVNSGVIDYIEHCDNLEAARKISDHLPVFLEFAVEIN